MQGPAKDGCVIIRPFHANVYLQYNVFVIYDESKAVPQGPSHDKVPQKHAANWQENTSHRSVVPTKLLLRIFIEITLWHGCPRPLFIMEGALKKEDVYCRIYFGIHSMTLSYDTNLHVPKQSCSKKLNIVKFVVMINDKPVIACYLLQCGISSSFHIFSLFLSLTGSSNITAKQNKSVIETVVI